MTILPTNSQKSGIPAPKNIKKIFWQEKKLLTGYNLRPCVRHDVTGWMQSDTELRYNGSEKRDRQRLELECVPFSGSRQAAASRRWDYVRRLSFGLRPARNVSSSSDIVDTAVAACPSTFETGYDLHPSARDAAPSPVHAIGRSPPTDRPTDEWTPSTQLRTDVSSSNRASKHSDLSLPAVRTFFRLC